MSNLKLLQKLKYCLLSGAGCFPALVFAGNKVEHHDPVASVILWVTLIIFFAIIGRYIARQMNQPGVLGELLMGVLIGNLCYFFNLQLAVILREGAAIFDITQDMLSGSPLAKAVKDNISNPFYANQVVTALSSAQGSNLLKVSYILDIFSRYGVVFLLFMVGLESSVQELKQTGKESIKVAIIGVVAPMLLGFCGARFLLPGATYEAALFVGATLSATSIGITASVLKEMKKLRTREARTILGAAMIDDILGLIILAVVSSMVISGAVDITTVGRIIISAILFFCGVLMIGPRLLRAAVHFFGFLELWEIKLFISFLFLMTLAWLATVVDLATIIGAFAAGLILHDNFFESRAGKGDDDLRLSIKNLIMPLESILAPLFFILIGIQVKIETFLNGHVLLMASGLITAAIVGKILSGFGGAQKDDRLLIGIGMLPRGEVGLVFASVGRTLGIMSDELFSAVILMIVVTTLATPPLLKARYAKKVQESRL